MISIFFVLASIASGSHMGRLPVVSVAERLVERTFERFEAIEVLTIVEGPERDMLESHGISSSNVDIESIKNQMKYVKMFFDQSEELSQQGAKWFSRLDFFRDLGQMFVSNIIQVMMFMPLTTPTLVKEYRLLKLILFDWQVWWMELHSGGSSDFLGGLTLVTDWSMPLSSAAFNVKMCLDRASKRVETVAKVIGYEPSEEKRREIMANVEANRQILDELKKVYARNESGLVSTCEEIGLLTQRSLERLEELRNVLPQDDQVITGMESAGRMIEYEIQPLEYSLEAMRRAIEETRISLAV